MNHAQRGVDGWTTAAGHRGYIVPREFRLYPVRKFCAMPFDVVIHAGRKAFQRPMKEGVGILNAIQDVYLDKEITIA